MKAIWLDNSHDYEKTITINDYCDYIEITLKDYEPLEKSYKEWCSMLKKYGIYSLESCENALKRLEQYETPSKKEDIMSVAKRLTALDIIKKLPKEEKQIILNAIYTHTKNEKEYDLLKEVLL